MAQETRERVVKAQVDVAAPNIPGAYTGGGVEMGARRESHHVAVDERKQDRFERKVCDLQPPIEDRADIFVQGGEPHYTSEIWKGTMHEHQNWAVIATIQTIPLIQLLEEDLQKQIKAISTAKPLTGKYALLEILFPLRR